MASSFVVPVVVLALFQGWASHLGGAVAWLQKPYRSRQK
jgi:hypothetical protein